MRICLRVLACEGGALSWGAAEGAVLMDFWAPAAAMAAAGRRGTVSRELAPLTTLHQVLV